MSSIFVGAFAFGIGFDVGITSFYDHWNKGVRRVDFCSRAIELTIATRNNGKTFAIDMSKKKSESSALDLDAIQRTLGT